MFILVICHFALDLLAGGRVKAKWKKKATNIFINLPVFCKLLQSFWHVYDIWPHVFFFFCYRCCIVTVVNATHQHSFSTIIFSNFFFLLLLFKMPSLNFIFLSQFKSQSILKRIKNINYEFTTTKLSEYWIQKCTIKINQNAINVAHIQIHIVSLLCSLCLHCTTHFDGSYRNNSNGNNIMHTKK